jgi:hypothetical protein
VHAADEFRRNWRRPAGSGGNEHEYLLGAHSQLALMGRFDSQFAGSGPGLHGPQIEREPVPESRGFDEVDGKMNRRRQQLLVME